MSNFSFENQHHRKWVISKINVDISKELSLCDEFLTADQRNFHCWNYRRFVVSEGNISENDELEFSFHKIQENFSNYSAFHHRSVFLKKCTFPNPKEFIHNEFSIIENAIFTEPDDQSAWW